MTSQLPQRIRPTHAQVCFELSRMECRTLLTIQPLFWFLRSQLSFCCLCDCFAAFSCQPTDSFAESTQAHCRFGRYLTPHYIRSAKPMTESSQSRYCQAILGKPLSLFHHSADTDSSEGYSIAFSCSCTPCKDAFQTRHEWCLLLQFVQAYSTHSFLCCRCVDHNRQR